MTAIQVIGKKQVLTQFEKQDCETWSLYQGKQFIVGGIGVNKLDDWLTGFEESGSAATYTLRIYDSDNVPTSSTANADYIACFNFKISDHYDGNGIVGHSNKLMDTIRGLQNDIQELKKPIESEPDDGFRMSDIISDWLQNPQKLGAIIGIAKQLFMGVSATDSLGASTPPLQTISGMNMETSEYVQAASPEGLDRISKALDVLGEYDPGLVSHLEKLAKLAKDEPLMFKAVIAKLDLL